MTKTRFAPSPTGHLHVGGARTALFSYLLARRHHGKFVLRIEDTDRARHVEEAVGMITQDLRWLGIEWDEGIEVGGDAAPYRQSERLEIYTEATDKLLATGWAYYAFDTAEELDALRDEAKMVKRDFRYPRPSPLPTADDAEKARAEGRPVVVRFRCPEEDVTVHDEAFGDVTVPAGQMEDFIIRKADGYPTFYLANVIDDAAMGITHVMRGQEFLGQTWRQTLLRQALELPEPKHVHLPLITDMQGRKLSKRDGAVEVHSFRRQGYLPEALLNFIVLLGWNPGGDREKMALEEMVDLFTIDRIGKTNAKFDRDKLLAFNTDALAEADDDRVLDALKDYLSLNETPIPAEDDELLRRLVQATRGIRTLADVVTKAGILFAPDEEIEYDPKAVRKVLEKNDEQGYEVLAELRPALEAMEDFSPEAVEKLIAAFCEEKDLGMGKVAQPLRVALTGKTVSPGIGETLAFCGREKALARIDRCLASR